MSRGYTHGGALASYSSLDVAGLPYNFGSVVTGPTGKFSERAPIFSCEGARWCDERFAYPLIGSPSLPISMRLANCWRRAIRASSPIIMTAIR